MVSTSFDSTEFLLYGRYPGPFSRAELLLACRAALNSQGVNSVGLERRVINSFVEHALFEREGSVIRFGEKLTFVEARLTRRLLDIAGEAARVYAQVLADERASLEALMPMLEVSGPSPRWCDVAHLLVAGLVIDLGVRSELLSQGLIAEQPDDFWVWAFEGGTGTRNAFGVQLWEGGEAVFGQLWHRGLRRSGELKVDDADVELLRVACESGGLRAAALPVGQHTRTVKLAFYRLLVKRGGTYVLNVPALVGAGGLAVCAEVRRIARALLARAVAPAMSEAEGEYRADGFRQVAGNHRHAFARLLLERAADEVVAAGLLPAFPDSAPHNWGAWLSSGGCSSELHVERKDHA